VSLPEGTPQAFTNEAARDADLVVSINRDGPLPAEVPQQHWQVSRTPLTTAQAASQVRDELRDLVRPDRSGRDC
jgi:hypothetical protein